MSINQFLEIEKKYDLYNISINGINCWNYYRTSLWNYTICAQKLNFDNYEYGKKGNYLKKLLKAIRHVKIPDDVDVLFINHERRVKNGDYYDCVYTEELSTLFPNSATFEVLYNGEHFKPIRTHNIIYNDVVVYKALLNKKLIRLLRPEFYKKLSADIRRFFSPALMELQDIYKCELNISKIVDALVQIVIDCSYKKKYYTKLIRSLNPKIIVEVVYYIQDKMLINEVANEQHIPIVELQHGTIYEEHLAYQYSEGYRIKQFPNYIFLFSDFWKKRMRVPISDDCLIPIGYPYFEEKLRKYKEEERKDKRYTIIFVSQHTIGHYLCDLAISLNTKLSGKDYRLIYKLHPAEYNDWEKNYPELKDSGIEVVADNQVSIYYYFGQSDMQIGVYSTSIYEGLGFNLSTLIVKVGAYKTMMPLIDRGYAALIENSQDVIDYLHSDNGRTVSVEQFWKSNAMENMLEEITKINPEVHPV